MLRNAFRPGYVRRRLRQKNFERTHPDAPWLTEQAVRLLDGWLRPTDRGIEWGSGRSTVWFAARVAHLTSVEDNADWYADVTRRLAAKRLSAKVDYHHVACECCEQDEPATHPYADVANELADGSLDFALVDGNIRLTCIRRGMPKLKPGGLLILDNANRYCPNLSLGSCATIHEPRTEPPSAGWAAVLRELEGWRPILTTDGIWDTRMWVKHCAA